MAVARAGGAHALGRRALPMPACSHQRRAHRHVEPPVRPGDVVTVALDRNVAVSR
jgi:hypothetical protein